MYARNASSQVNTTLAVVTTNTALWQNAKMILDSYNIVLRIIDAADSNDSWLNELMHTDFAFVICDSASVYKKLPQDCTLLVFSSQPANAISCLLHDVFTSITTGDKKRPLFVLWLDNQDMVAEIQQFFEEWEFAYEKGEINSVEKYAGAPSTYHLVDNRDALQALNTINPNAILLPNKRAAQSFINFLTELLFSYMNIEAKIKLSKDYGLL